MIDTIDKLRCGMTSQIQSHPFLKSCRDGSISERAMRIFLQQQALYSCHFTRYLCALMSNLHKGEQVHALAENLFEELGLDGGGATPHSVLYKNMLDQFCIDYPVEELALPETKALVQEMYRSCRDDDCANGLGALCLGAEALVPVVYGDILRGLKVLGRTDEECVFFSIHIECDDGHAETMERILIDLMEADPRKIAVAANAGERVVKARYKFFDGIQNEASFQSV